jgi:hypothetical protein
LDVTAPTILRIMGFLRNIGILCLFLAVLSNGVAAARPKIADSVQEVLGLVPECSVSWRLGLTGDRKLTGSFQ